MTQRGDRRPGFLAPALAIVAVAAVAAGALVVPMRLAGKGSAAGASLDSYRSRAGAGALTTGAGRMAGAGAGAAGAAAASFPLTPSDPYFSDQWGLIRISAPQAWQIQGATGRGVVVGVVDSGLDLQHEDLQCSDKLAVVPNSDRISGDDNPDDEFFHGTHVAGIIGACTNNGAGTAGVAPDATILPVRSLDAAGNTTNLATVADGITLATAEGAHVINLSLSVSITPGIPDIFPGVINALDAAIADAAAHGVVVVASAGNDAMPLCAYPALAEKVICVGATDPRDIKTFYSNFALKQGSSEESPTVVAPGGTETAGLCGEPSENVLSLVPAEHDPCEESRAGYADLAGTSMAAPHVAGVAALVYGRLGAVRSVANATAVKKAIVANTDDLGLPGNDPIYGYGRVNALNAVQSVPYVPVTAAPGGRDPSTSRTFGYTASSVAPPSAEPATASGNEQPARKAAARAAASQAPSPSPSPVPEIPIPEVRSRASRPHGGSGGWGTLAYGLAFSAAAVLAWSRFT